jgi:hypothetical protein
MFSDYLKVGASHGLRQGLRRLSILHLLWECHGLAVWVGITVVDRSRDNKAIRSRIPFDYHP